MKENSAMNDSGRHPSQDAGHEVTRRSFLESSRNVAIGTVVGSTLSGLFWLDDAVAAIPASEGYLLVDTTICQGCTSCMLACSLVHEGVESPSLARIQVIQNSFGKWPDDLTVEYRYAGEGTFWTDAKSPLTDVAAKKILQQKPPRK